MKKFIAIITAIILVCAVAVTASAYGRGKNGYNFVDKNNDSICDNRNENCNGSNFVDSDKDGICDNKAVTERGNAEAPKGNRSNFVDSDKDGICDNRNGAGRGNGCCRKAK